jgi:hypothetical protein
MVHVLVVEKFPLFVCSFWFPSHLVFPHCVVIVDPSESELNSTGHFRRDGEDASPLSKRRLPGKKLTTKTGRVGSLLESVVSVTEEWHFVSLTSHTTIVDVIHTKQALKCGDELKGEQEAQNREGLIRNERRNDFCAFTSGKSVPGETAAQFGLDQSDARKAGFGPTFPQSLSFKSPKTTTTLKSCGP